MLKYSNNSDTAVIVLHEIYGINKHIVNICEKLSKLKYDVLAPNMLNCSEPFRYEQEDVAYDYFINHIGFVNASKQIKQILYNMRTCYTKIYVVGYSIGATVAWLSSETNLCDAIVGFYGSRIRNYIDVVPKCPVLLFFPTKEEAFNVNELIAILRNKEHVKIKKLCGQHGFADPFSKKYDKKMFIKACRDINSFVKTIGR